MSARRPPGAVLAALLAFMASAAAVVATLARWFPAPAALLAVVQLATAVQLGRGHPAAAWWASFSTCLALPYALALGVFGLVWPIAVVAPSAVVLVLGLAGPAARRHVHLVCPACGSFQVSAGDWSFRTRRCRECGAAWQASGPVHPEPEVFD